MYYLLCLRIDFGEPISPLLDVFCFVFFGDFHAIYIQTVDSHAAHRAQEGQIQRDKLVTNFCGTGGQIKILDIEFPEDRIEATQLLPSSPGCGEEPSLQPGNNYLALRGIEFVPPGRPIDDPAPHQSLWILRKTLNHRGYKVAAHLDIIG